MPCKRSLEGRMYKSKRWAKRWAKGRKVRKVGDRWQITGAINTNNVKKGITILG